MALTILSTVRPWGAITAKVMAPGLEILPEAHATNGATILTADTVAGTSGAARELHVARGADECSGRKEKIAVIGSGNWGSVAAKLLASNSRSLSQFHGTRVQLIWDGSRKWFHGIKHCFAGTVDF